MIVRKKRNSFRNVKCSSRIFASRKLESLIGESYDYVMSVLKSMGLKEVEYGDENNGKSGWVELEDKDGREYCVYYYRNNERVGNQMRSIAGEVYDISGPDDFANFIGPDNRI